MCSETFNALQNAVRFIENNLRRKLSIEDISKHVHLSRFYLQHLFKEAFGISISQYVNSRKLESSLYELDNTSLKLFEIALEYGFEWEQSYIRAFKRKYGITPGRYRNNPYGKTAQSV